MKLEELTRLAQPLLEAAPAALCILDLSGREVFANRTCRNMRRRSGGDRAEDGAPIRLDGREVGRIVTYHDLSEVARLRTELERMDQKLRTIQARYTFQDIVGKDPKLLQAVKLAKGVAATPATILIQGESGTGKELFAQAIHNHSNRRREKLVTVNCSALSEELLESELFGYVDGAFTGARRGGKPGLFQRAHRGTLFLDEIGDISPRLQVRLLRVLQEHEVLPVGGSDPIPVDVRLISATHRDLEAMTAAGQFREDLYYRLNVFPIRLPPLRERPGDIEAIVQYLLVHYGELYRRRADRLEPEAAELLRIQPWRGNVRELENVVTRVLVGVPEEQTALTRADFEAVLPAARPQRRAPVPQKIPEVAPLSQVLEQTERSCICQALERCGGDKNKAAYQLGLPLRTLYYKCRRLGIGS